MEGMKTNIGYVDFLIQSEFVSGVGTPVMMESCTGNHILPDTFLSEINKTYNYHGTDLILMF